MKNKLIKKIALAMSFITMFGTLPVNAYELDSRGMSIESVEYQNSEDEDFINASEVFAEIGSTYQVTIPKVIVLSGESKSAEYKVSAEGDIAGCETIFVKPDSFVNLFAVNKGVQVGTITQDKIGWTNNTIDEIGNGLIKADGITAGRWSGTFNFEIFLNLVLGDVIAPDHEHNPGEAQVENVVQPDCINTGSYDEVVYCTDCYKELSRELKTIPANGHTPGSVVDENRVEPTCVLNGSIDKVTYCTVCGEELSREQEKIPFLGHDFVDYVCTRCGIDEHEHTCANILIENEIEPTNGNPGSHEEVYVCDICGLEYERKTIYTPIETEFAYTGTIQTYTVPFDGVYQLEAWGAKGGSSSGYGGGNGGYAKGSVALSKGDVLYVVVGGQGGGATIAGAGWDDTHTVGIAPGYNGSGSGYSLYLHAHYGGAHGSNGGSTNIGTKNELLNGTDGQYVIGYGGGSASSYGGWMDNGNGGYPWTITGSGGSAGGAWTSEDATNVVTTNGVNTGNGKAKITFISK